MITESGRLLRARVSRRRTDEGGPVFRLPVFTILIVALLAAVLLGAAWREARQMSAQSDGSSIALQAWAMLHGNLLLHGWRTADLSFYTTEIPVYMVIEAVRGLRGSIAIAAAVNYTLLVAGAAAVAKGRVPGREGLVRAATAVVIMAIPSVVAGRTLLWGPDHTATAIWVLLALIVAERAGRRWHGPVLAALILAWASVGDPLIQVIGAAPLALAGLVRAARLRDRRYLSLVAAAIAAVAAAHEATALISSAGGWQVVSSGERFVTAAQLPGNLAVEAEDFLGLYSADFLGQKAGPPLIPVLAHLVIAAAVAVAIIIAARRFVRGPADGEDADLTADVLVAAIACNLLAYLLLYQASPGQIREVAPVFALGAALAGRVLGGPLARARAEPVLAVGVAACVLSLGPAVNGRPAAPQTQPLARWLAAHHLTSGLAGYWQANSTELASAGPGQGPSIEVRPVKGTVKGTAQGGRPVPYIWEAYLPSFRSGQAHFLVLTTGVLAANPAITVAGATREFGKPSHVYRFDQYTILTWHRNILPDMPPPPAGP